MIGRTLQFESLERRDLLSADLDWPSGVGVAADVFVDGGYSLSGVSLSREAELLGWTRETLLTSSYSLTRSTIGGNSNDTNGALLFPDGQPRVGVYYHNGGNSSAHQSALGASGKAAIIDFLAAGGSYTGSCAGAWTAKNFGFYVGSWLNNGGSGSHTITLADDGNPISEFMIANGQSLIVPSVPFYGGPGFLESRSRTPDAEFIGKLTSGYPSYMRGTDAIILVQPTGDEGGVAIVPNHPEYGRRAIHTYYMAAVLSWAYDTANVTPDVKGSLDYSHPAVTADVGDGQYHRYAMQVAPGTRELTITTSNAAGTELYVTLNGVAYAGGFDFAGDEIVISNPAAGEWEVSVLGTHAVKNGVHYTLTVGATIGPLPSWWSVEFNAERPWQNPIDRFDVNGDGLRSPLDALILINAINVNGLGYTLPAIQTWPTICLDVRGDGLLDLYDVLDVLIEIL